MSKKHKQNLAYRAFKRFIDIVVSCIGCVFLVPLTLIVKITYLCHGDTYPIFLKQYRIGKNGKQFRIWKYRTMVPGAEEKLEDILAKNKDLREEYRKNRKLEDDPRVTKMGHRFRRASLDELPQLINVLIGNMSLVGNRPYLLPEKSEMNGYYKIITSTKPGITGWWQVNGRNNVDFNKRLELEKFYSENQCFTLDVKIVFKTFGTVLSRKGAS